MTQAVVEAPELVEITMTPEVQIILGYTYQIDAQLNIPTADIASISWTPAEGLSCDTCLNPIAQPFNSTLYTLQVTSDVGCDASGTVLIKVDKNRQIYVPNIFSPNEDGTNDLFSVFADPVTVLKIKTFQVFTRWGEAVYELKDLSPGVNSPGWDGTYKGERMNPAVFVWQAVVVFVDGKEETFKGDVTLKR
jgi:gliding motility-associated-like protein